MHYLLNTYCSDFNLASLIISIGCLVATCGGIVIAYVIYMHQKKEQFYKLILDYTTVLNEIEENAILVYDCKTLPYSDNINELTDKLFSCFSYLSAYGSSHKLYNLHDHFMVNPSVEKEQKPYYFAYAYFCIEDKYVRFRNKIIRTAKGNQKQIAQEFACLFCDFIDLITQNLDIIFYKDNKKDDLNNFKKEVYKLYERGGKINA